MQKDTETPEVRTEENYTDEVVCKKQMKVLTTTMPFVVEKEKKIERLWAVGIYMSTERILKSTDEKAWTEQHARSEQVKFLQRVSNLQILERV